MKNYRATGLAFIFAAISSAPALAAPLPGSEHVAGNLSGLDGFVPVAERCDRLRNPPATEQPQTGQRVLTAELRNAGGKVEGVLLMPFGLDLAKGASLKIDEAAGPNLAFSTCLPQGCLAPISFDAKQVAALKAGANINVTTTALSPSQPVAFKISLKGFGAALDRITTLTK